MYTTTIHFSDSTFRASRHAGDPGCIWFRNDDGLSVSVSCAEAAQLVAELQRELAAVEAEKREVAA